MRKVEEKASMGKDGKNSIFYLKSTLTDGSSSSEKNHHDELSDIGSQEIVELFDRYRKALKLFVQVTVKCENIAEEIAQESYLRFMRVQNEKVIEHPRAYLFRTAQNLSIDFLRRRALNVIDTKVEVNEDTVEGTSESPEEQAILTQTKSELERILIDMPRKSRQVFYYRRYDGYSIKEISSRMNISERMVFKYMRKAMQILAAGLKRAER